MDKNAEFDGWNRYASISRNVLTHVLLWDARQVDHFVEKLFHQMEAREGTRSDFGFFHDPPFHYLFQPILGSGLYERIMSSRSESANPSLLFERLVDAVKGAAREEAMEAPDFNWAQARLRYELERKRIEDLLTTLESESAKKRAKD